VFDYSGGIEWRRTGHIIAPNDSKSYHVEPPDFSSQKRESYGVDNVIFDNLLTYLYPLEYSRAVQYHKSIKRGQGGNEIALFARKMPRKNPMSCRNELVTKNQTIRAQIKRLGIVFDVILY